METIVINGDVWGVVRTHAGDPRLIDRTGTVKLGTTNPWDHVICIDDSLEPPLLDKVVLHEVTHAITVSWDLVDGMHRAVMMGSPAEVEELSARLLEDHAIEAVQLASQILGRKVCVRGVCRD